MIGHNGWAAQRIIGALASHPFHKPIRVLTREGSDASRLPPNVERYQYTWHDEDRLRKALDGVDILM